MRKRRHWLHTCCQPGLRLYCLAALTLRCERPSDTARIRHEYGTKYATNTPLLSSPLLSSPLLTSPLLSLPLSSGSMYPHPDRSCEYAQSNVGSVRLALLGKQRIGPPLGRSEEFAPIARHHVAHVPDPDSLDSSRRPDDVIAADLAEESGIKAQRPGLNGWGGLCRLGRHTRHARAGRDREWSQETGWLRSSCLVSGMPRFLYLPPQESFSGPTRHHPAYSAALTRAIAASKPTTARTRRLFFRHEATPVVYGCLEFLVAIGDQRSSRTSSCRVRSAARRSRV